MIELRHPEYDARITDWYKWRAVYEGGDAFIQTYVKRFSTREDEKDFSNRKAITPIPAFAKAGINDIKNSIFQRTVDITRVGGPKTYQAAIEGKLAGVDMNGDTMNGFMGRQVIGELLAMAKVGICIDMPYNIGPTLADNQGKHPYLYRYRAEDILNWAYMNDDNQSVLSRLLLRDRVYEIDPITGMPKSLKEQYRFYSLENGKVTVQYFSTNGTQIDRFVLNLNRIPFVILETSSSLLTDVANHQIGLVNLESSDMMYLLKSNFPFYTEQVDPRWHSPHIRGPANPPEYDDTVEGGTVAPNPGTSTAAETSSGKNINVGASHGRAYPIGTDRPGFIHPSSEPVKASIDKQEKLKADIRTLLNLSLANIRPKMASAESKGYDEHSLEAGLSAIGLELQYAEQQIATHWAAYERSSEIATIKYPAKYSLRAESDTRAEVQEARANLAVVPSQIYKKEMAKKIVDLTIGADISYEELQTIYLDIDKAEIIPGNLDDLIKCIEAGLIDAETVSKALGFPEGVVKKAQQEHAERLARIAIAQSQAPTRGVKDVAPTGVNPKELDNAAK